MSHALGLSGRGGKGGIGADHPRSESCLHGLLSASPTQSLVLPHGLCTCCSCYLSAPRLFPSFHSGLPSAPQRDLPAHPTSSSLPQTRTGTVCHALSFPPSPSSTSSCFIFFGKLYPSCGPKPVRHLFCFVLFFHIKFYWNAAMPIHLYIAKSFFCAAAADLRHDREPMGHRT